MVSKMSIRLSHDYKYTTRMSIHFKTLKDHFFSFSNFHEKIPLQIPVQIYFRSL